MPIKICAHCGKEFVCRNKHRKYCSHDCKRANEPYYINHKQAEQVKKRCIACGQEYVTVKPLQQHYCSGECAVKAKRLRASKRYEQFGKPAYLAIRFRVFERDNFRCRYCGRSPDDGAKLVIDHILAKCKGGQDELSNYVTACVECNAGKGDILLLANEEGQLPTFIKLKE